MVGRGGERGRIYGIVLAGGRSRRMGGPEKAFVDLAGRPLLDRVIDRLRPQCRGVVLSANGDPARFARFGVPVVGDEDPGSAGPLAGIVTTLDWLAFHRPDADAAVTCPVDTPFVPGTLVERLGAAALRGGTPSACAVSEGRRHYGVALWPVGVRQTLRGFLDTGERRLSSALETLGCTDTVWPADPFDPFFNINTPDDLATAGRLLPAL